jgi:hypothetical protein
LIGVRLTNDPQLAAHGGDLMRTHFALAFALLALAPVPALAETQDEQNACMNDAFSVCGHAIPDRHRVGACLAQNIHRISGPAAL